MDSMIRRCALLAVILLLELGTASQVYAQTDPVDPALTSFLAGAGVAQWGVKTVALPGDAEPKALVLRRSGGWIRAGTAVAAASAGVMITWAAMLEGPPTIRGCQGAWTPVAMVTPLIVGGALALAGILRSRKLRHDGIQPWPLTGGRRAMRVFATAASVVGIAAVGTVTILVDRCPPY